MSPIGKFIVIEGPDGSGKETQQKKLAERLNGNGVEVLMVDFPQYDTSLFGAMAGNMLAGRYGAMKNIHPIPASLVYATDRWKAKPKIVQAQQAGQLVLANRYTLSNMAHQSARLPADQRWDFISEIEKIEYSTEGFEIPRPDLYIVLSVPVEISRELIVQKVQRSYLGSDVTRDQLEEDIEHQVEAAKMYKELAQKLPGITVVECTNSEGQLMSREAIHELVWEQTRYFLQNISVEGQTRRERES